MLFFGAFFIRLIVFVVFSCFAVTANVLSSNPDKRAYPVVGADADGYVATARVLLEEGRFASPGMAEPQSYLMPGYPALLAFVFFLDE